MLGLSWRLQRRTSYEVRDAVRVQLPKPWDEEAELRLIEEATEQIVLADKIGIDHAWAVEHHFLEEYSHCSASDVFLASLAAKTERIRIGLGIRQVIPNYNHPSRTAETVAMLDLFREGELNSVSEKEQLA
ncbi:MAG: hypothetical protein Ct9H300mP26_0200 [Acidimicrobiales bacterium]|nr:MAG: hypothetical protein Ct9H300mP26_0200 [Acidimicrobiales bacterium]